MSIRQQQKEAELRQRVVSTVARLARVDVSFVRPETSFEELGLDSLAAVTLTAELADELGIALDPALTWDFPTVEEAIAALLDRFQP
jgi:acyl carrier protein